MRLQEDAAPTPDAPAAPEPTVSGSGDALAPALEAATLNDGSEVAAAAVPSAAAGGALDMDSLLELAVLQGLHSLRTAELPIQSSDFYTRHMIPCRPDGAQLPAWRGSVAAQLRPAALTGPSRPRCVFCLPSPRLTG